jgi:hypothetical protein
VLLTVQGAVWAVRLDNVLDGNPVTVPMSAIEYWAPVVPSKEEDS